MPRVTITIPEKNAQPYRFQLDREVVSLGRGSENDIAIDSGSVSVHHAEMRRVKGGYELHDVGSTNGIKLDGLRQTLVPLRSGMTVKIGEVAFDFTLSEEENEKLAQEKSPELPPITGEPEMAGESAPDTASWSGRKSDGSPLAATILFIILAALAFFTGLEVRHRKDTGESLIRAIQMKSATPTEVPASK